jgi:acyl-CoA thioester hydrolase
MARIHIGIPLRWSDFDAYAHVNNAEMLRLLEEARIQAFWRPDEGGTGADTALLDARPGSELSSVIGRQEIEYLAPIPYMRAPLEVEMWFGRIGGSSAEVCYELYSPAGVSPRRLYTRAATTLVLVGRDGRPSRVTDELRAAWSPYVEDPVEFRRR